MSVPRREVIVLPPLHVDPLTGWVVRTEAQEW
jgi:hypothetical protein